MILCLSLIRPSSHYLNKLKLENQVINHITILTGGGRAVGEEEGGGRLGVRSFQQNIIRW